MQIYRSCTSELSQTRQRLRRLCQAGDIQSYKSYKSNPILLYSYRLLARKMQCVTQGNAVYWEFVCLLYLLEIDVVFFSRYEQNNSSCNGLSISNGSLDPCISRENQNRSHGGWVGGDGYAPGENSFHRQN
jgi:hypothetical protein